MKSYRTVHNFGWDEIVINKSKFIGYAKPIGSEDEAIEFINSIRKKHSDATHNVYAYVFGENNSIQRYSDDGEPSGTAGMPVLNVISQEKLKNVAVVVTRYFGGIKLGTGGLARAYTSGAKIAIESGIIVDKTPLVQVCCSIDYTLLGKVENELSKNEYIIKSKDFAENVQITILCLDENLKTLNELLLNATNGKCDIVLKDELWFSVKDGNIIE